MISDDLKRELDFRHHYLLNTFGGVNAYIDVLSTKYNLITKSEYNKLLLAVHKFLTHPGPVTVISPWSMSLKLYNNEGGMYHNDAIVFEEPYSIYNDRGQLLYSVAGHDGTFGESILDRTLVLQSQSTDQYFLQYPTYSGEVKTHLLVVNLITLTSPTTNIYLHSPVNEPDDTLTSQILFKYKTYRNPGLTAEVYFLPSAPARIPTQQAILNNQYSILAIEDLEFSDTFTFNPSKSGWVTIILKNNNLRLPLKITNILGQGIDRFIPTRNDQLVYYLALGSELDLVTVQNSLGVRVTIPPALSTSNLINLNCEIEV